MNVVAFLYEHDVRVLLGPAHATLSFDIEFFKKFQIMFYKISLMEWCLEWFTTGSLKLMCACYINA